MDKKYILSEIDRTAKENGGKPLGRERFEKETGIKLSDWYPKIWIRWNDAIKEAGYTPNRMQSSYDADFLLQKIIELIQEIGHFPTAPELRQKAFRDKNFPSHNTFNRFGKKPELVQVVLKYCETHDVDNSVVKACQAAVVPSPRSTSQKATVTKEFGFVYLIKSGKYYKIGRSNCAEKREYELRIQLPEKPDLIHKIKTDDPVGIEQYWHERFKDKRRGGEWFELSPTDVKDFSRRTLM